MIYIFDGSYYGLLTAVFTVFERKEFQTTLATANNTQNLFEQQIEISTDINKASRVLNGLMKKLDSSQVYDFYQAFLSEDFIAWNTIFKIIVHIFLKDAMILQNYGDNDVLYFSQTLRKVNRERHRMKAFVRFQKDSSGMYFSIVEPDFDVLPLIANFFKKRYADQKWLIYDSKRQYGIFYDLKTITEVQLTANESKALIRNSETVTIDEKDEAYQKMWKSYYQSTNIEARKNMKLHLRHVPKRYWKYLPEKN